MICLEMHDEVDTLHVERNHLVGCSYLNIIDKSAAIKDQTSRAKSLLFWFSSLHQHRKEIYILLSINRDQLHKVHRNKQIAARKWKRTH
jgi:hypothetical protein